MFRGQRRHATSTAMVGAVVATLLVAASPMVAAPADSTTPLGRFIAPKVASAATTDRWIVRYSSAQPFATRVAATQSTGAVVTRRFLYAFIGAAIIGSPQQALAVSRQPGVISVEPDQVVRPVDTQENPDWGLDRIDQRARPLSTSYSYVGAGAGVKAYVIDSGIRSTHVDFAGRIAPGITIVNDGLGTGDCLGHGTHVSGTLGGTTYGVAKAVTLVPVRIFPCSGSALDSDVITGINWVIGQHAANTPAVANLSLSGTQSPALDTAVANLVADGVTVAVAAGNSALDACTQSPADVASALTVGASDATDVQPSFSNYGTCLDLYAPGVNITSDWYTSDTATAGASGTSMSTPFVAGDAARILSLNPTWTPAQVATALVSTASTGVLAGLGPNSPNKLLFDDPTVSLSGVVRDAAGAGMPGIQVQVQRAGGAVDATAVSDATGAYALRMTTGSMSLTMTAAASAPATVPRGWTIGPLAFTSSAARVADLALPAMGTATLQFYDSGGNPVSGINVHQVGSYSPTTYTVSSFLPAAAPAMTIGPIITGADGRAVVRSFLGTIPTLLADDTSTGSLLRSTFTNLAFTDGLAFAVQRGTSVIHTPTVVFSDQMLARLESTILASQPDLFVVPFGGSSTAAAHQFGCVIPAPRDSTEAQSALFAATYIDVTGVTRNSPSAPCSVFSVATP